MSDYNNTSQSFRPVKCTEEVLKTLTPIDGYVAFTTDTKKIYACLDGEYKMMGGSSGVYYGERTLSDDELYGDEVFFTFLPEHIDGDNLPAVDDLILNIPDGGFYRVLDFNDTEISTQRIAISGGGSGGGTGGGSTSSQGSLDIVYITPQSSTTLTGVDYYIEYEIIAKDSAGDPIIDSGTATWKINGKEYVETVYAGVNRFKVDEYLDASLTTNKISLVVSMNTGGYDNNIKSKTWNIKAVNLSLKWDYEYSTDSYYSDDTFNLRFIPIGGVDCTVHIALYDKFGIKVREHSQNILAKDTGKEKYSDPIESLPYGSYTCEMYLTSPVSPEPTEPIRHDLTFILGGNSTILTVPFYKTVATQYDTLNIPFMVYDPDVDTCNVSFYVNDIRVGGDSYDRGLHYWPYTLAEYGTVKLTIKTDNDEASRDFNLFVNELELDASEAAGAAFSLKANSFSSNNELRNWKHNGVTLTFSDNFDWDNGGLKFEEKPDGSIEKYICVRQGTTMTVNYKLFEKFTSGAAGGKNFKLCFKASNCYDYDAPILNCYDPISKVGVRVNAQNTTFSCATYPNFATQYFENSYIELETEIWPNVADPDPENNLYGDRFMMFWVDGVPAGVKAYPYGEPFTQAYGEEKNIVVGSDLCDVYIYVMKAYERKLTEDEHLENFIMDAPSTEKMLDRYNRNDILDNTGEISYTKLVEKNPECHIYMYDMERMTQHKKDKIESTYTELFGDHNTLDNPYYKAEGAKVYVQGTSSAAYGVAAFNLRTEFKKGLTDKDGESVSGWKINDSAMPIDLACTKVNVASSENCNNVVNQEWYNEYQPYHDAHRRKNDGNAYRDTMQFETGVVFIKDNNPIDEYLSTGGIDGKKESYLAANCFLDTPGYANKPYYKMYSIANMGNDKKNSEVFHDTTNPKACCVEVTNNQDPEHWMTVKSDESTYDLETLFYEFRYPDGNDAASAEQKKAWLDFVDWMSSCDPNPYHPIKHPYGYTGDPLPAPVEYGPYTFKGFDPPGYEGTPNPSGITLKGITETKYAGKYEYDTYEYRMAKMLNECEDHLVMDSIMFHYLFIQRHTMVDNVAKNTFWSSEDLIHWDLTKDYDNDTADGNNNSGNLVYTYGIECLDTEEVVDETTGEVGQMPIFNASDSVWFNFISGLPTAQKSLHQQLAVKGAWKSQPYLNECIRHQDRIPERCWIYDYFRKYIRPRRLGLDENTYLNRLEGGKKTHQRTQFENYQEFYLNSKYLADKPFTAGGAIDMRLNADPKGSWNEDISLEASYYIDCYSAIELGGNLHQSPRLKRGQVYKIPAGKIMASPSDATSYFFGAAMLQTFSGLADTYPQYCDLANAGKLRSIEYGSDREGYYNPYLKSLDIGSNKMLQYAQVQNSGLAAGIGATDLTNASQLKELLTNGSTLQSLIFPDNGVVETINLNALSSLTMSNLLKLENVTLDEGIYTSMTNLSVKNCPAMDEHTYKMVLNGPIVNYTLTEFNWVVNSIDELEIKNDKVTGIKVVDKLMKTRPSNETHAASFVGTILIDVNCNIDEYDMYEKYCKTYPNLIIEYSDKVTGLNPAVELRFMTSNAETAEIHYRVLGNGEANGASIGTLISSEGPIELEITDPNKESTAQYDYMFTGYWTTNPEASIILHNKDYDKDIVYYYKDGLLNAMNTATNFNNVIPMQDYVFYPVYKESKRTHEVTFYDLDKNIIEIINVPYGNTIKSAGAKTTNYYYLDGSKLLDYQRYGFKGWTTVLYEPGKGKNLTFYNVDTYEVEGPINLFPYFEIEDCRKVPTNPDYFEYNASKNALVLKSEYRFELTGKITIPNMNYPSTNNPITTVTLFESSNMTNGNSKITHIYFLEGSTQYTKIGPYGFTGCSSLKKVELPNSITSIEAYGFHNCTKLEEINLNDNITNIGQYAFSAAVLNTMSLKLTALPKNLKTLGGSAFRYGGPGLEITSIPAGVTMLNTFTFNDCPNVKIESFGNVENSKAPGITQIGASCFANAGNGSVGSVTSVIFGANVKSIGSSAFSNYATNTLNETSGEVIFMGLTQEQAEQTASTAGFSGVTIVGSYTG